jgi:hypothetical protein
MEHDAEGQRYFVSNTGSNSINQRSYDGTLSAFASNLPGAPYGIELQGDTLFACINGGIRGYSTVDATEVFNLPLGGTFLNGLTSDGEFLYTTDFSTKKIFKVDPGHGHVQRIGEQHRQHTERHSLGCGAGPVVDWLLGE